MSHDTTATEAESSLTPRLQRVLSGLIAWGPISVGEMARRLGFMGSVVSSSLYELRRLGLAGNGPPGPAWERGNSKRRWDASETGKQTVIEPGCEAIQQPEQKEPAPPAEGSNGAGSDWSLDRIKALFTERGTDKRDKGLYARDRTREEMVKITGLPVADLESTLVRRNGFAEHNGKWTWNPLLEELAREEGDGGP